MKGKFAMGVGVGIICGALLLQLLLIVDSPPSEAVNFGADGESPSADATVMSALGGDGAMDRAAMDEDALREAADRMGFRLVPSGERMYTAAELEQAVEEARKDAANAAGGTGNATEENGGRDERTELVVPSGATLTQVARELERLELIDDEQRFIDWMKERRLQRRIVAGYYSFYGRPSYEVIADVITR